MACQGEAGAARPGPSPWSPWVRRAAALGLLALASAAVAALEAPFRLDARWRSSRDGADPSASGDLRPAELPAAGRRLQGGHDSHHHPPGGRGTRPRTPEDIDGFVDAQPQPPTQPPKVGHAENVVMWSLDDDAPSRLLFLDSLRTFVDVDSRVKHKTYAMALVVSGPVKLPCSWVKDQGIDVKCVDLTVGPHDLAGVDACRVPKVLRQSLAVGSLHVINLSQKEWIVPLMMTVDKLAKRIQEGYISHRSELVASRGNHLRFIADTIFLDLGVRQVLYTDNDACVREDVGEIFKIKGDEAVVAAVRTDSKGVEKALSNEDISLHSKVVESYGFTTSFNAGVVLFRTQAMCKFKLLEKMLDVQFHHNKEPLWTRGTNQPPFEIAAAKSLRTTHYFWNCRISSVELVDMERLGLREGSPLHWISRCRIFHPSAHQELDPQRKTCSAFNAMLEKAEGRTVRGPPEGEPPMGESP